ncbi:MAG: MATE family efflux transporter, partial [Akkermansiaceae bacterium]|nr:MATE family efflux transporter [Akkermansiaceae bacterium]
MALPHHIDALEHEPVGKLLLQYSMPAIAGMAAMSLYNVIDSAFIGYGVGAHALAALAVAFPIMNLGAALG